MSEARPSRLFILAGERGLGKTSVCRALATELAAQGRVPGGLLTRTRRNEAGLPWELELEELRGGERRPLASREAELGGPALAGKGPGGSLGAPPPFSFSGATLAWALDLLEAELSRRPALLIVDEIGPLELELGKGLRPFLDRLAEGLARGLELPSLLLTVRPSLAGPLAALFPPGRVERLALGLENRATLPFRILGSV